MKFCIGPSSSCLRYIPGSPTCGPPGATTTHATAGAVRRLAQTTCAIARLGDADERVADRAELVLHARAPAPLRVAALERPPRHDGRVGGGAAIGAAAIPDHLHVLGVRAGRAAVAAQVVPVARDDGRP